MKELVYLSAPYSDPDPKVVEERISAFCKIDSVLSNNNIFTVSPLYKHLIFQYATLPTDWEYWKTYCETLLSSCDKMIIIRLPGWDLSVGVKGEIEYCNCHKIPIEYMHPDDIVYYEC